MTLRVVHVSAFDDVGGAARAARSLHTAMATAGIESTLVVGRKDGGDPSVIAPRPRVYAIAGMADRSLWRLERSPRVTWRSPAVFGSLRVTDILRQRPDVVNLHWVTNGLLTVRAIGALARSGVPVAWSMYDQYALAGTEHYEAASERWRRGYSRENRPGDESGVDLDRWTWERKRRYWTTPITMVPASGWLEECARDSALLRDWPVVRIPHLIDTETMHPVSRTEARSALDLPQDRPLVLFLATAGIHDRRKGWDLLEAALTLVRRDRPDVEAIVAGPASPDAVTLPVHWLGELSTSDALRAAYCAADVVAVPSRSDTMPLTAMEAQACGRAVAAFAVGGLPDIVADGRTGALAPAEDVPGLARALESSLDEADSWGREARERAIGLWSPRAVVRAYTGLYEAMLGR